MYNRIRDLREEKDLRQKDMAEHMKDSEGAYSH